jgi:hypothetical protein
VNVNSGLAQRPTATVAHAEAKSPANVSIRKSARSETTERIRNEACDTAMVKIKI